MELMTQMIFKILKLYKSFMKEEMEKLHVNIPPHQFKFLKVINKSKQCKAKDLSLLFDCDKAHIARVIKKLERLDLIIKNQDKNDLRSEYISLSLKGQKLIKKLIKLDHLFEKKIKAKYNENEFKQLKNLLDKLA